MRTLNAPIGLLVALMSGCAALTAEPGISSDAAFVDAGASDAGVDGGVTNPADGGLDAGGNVDADAGVDAGGNVEVDAGETLPEDAGTTTPDAGPPPDAGTSPYAADGPFSASSTTASVSTGSSTFTVRLDIPSGSEARPVVVLASGLQQTAAGYAPYARRLASHGITTITRDDPGPFTNTAQVTSDISYLVATWLPAENARSGSPLFGRVDVTRIGLAGHSRGGKASCLAAETGAHGLVKGWFGIDPVDSVVLSGDAQARTTLGSIGVPIAMIGAGVTSSCSPAADNYKVLYAASASPAVSITAVGAGHTQFQSQSACTFCGLCSPAGTADSATVLEGSVRYLTAFFARELLGDTNVGAAFEGAGVAGDVAAGRITIESK